MHKLRIFVASSADMSAERDKVETVVSMLKPLADNLGIVLEVVDWHAVVPDMGSPQKVILKQLKLSEWDVFIGILWHRFGVASASRKSQAQVENLSGAEEEFKTVYRLWQQYQRPRIMIYRCTRPVTLDALDPDQFKRVKEFFSQFDLPKGDPSGLYQSFDTTESFERLVLDNLQRLLLEYAEEIKGKPVAPESVQAFAPKIPDNLPRRAPFFGRDREMDVVLRALSPEDRTWGVLLDGIGGIGKSALAIEAAYRCKETGLFDAFIFVSAKQNILEPERIRELKPAARTLNEFLNETAFVLGRTDIAQLASDDKRRALLEALREMRVLLIYDNLETLAKEEQEVLADYLRRLPLGCKAIITSRRRGGEGAVWLRLEKLEWEAARAIIESEMARDPQLAHKLRRAGEACWRELYDETKGSPLALVHTLGLMRLRAALTLDGALDLLRGNRDADLQRFIFQEARRELTTNDETALRALSFFVPSATFEAWMEVAELSRNALETTIDRLSALSLVDVLANEDRYALHPLTRNFVRDELLADAQIARATGIRFAENWVAYAQRYGGRKENYKTFDRLEAEWMNLDATGEWLWQTIDIQGNEVSNKDAAQHLNELTGALCGANSPLSYIGRWDESIRLSVRAYEAMYALKKWQDAGWHAHQVAIIHRDRANIEEAMRWADRCDEAWSKGRNRYTQATGLILRGQLVQQREDLDFAERLYQEALSILRDLKDAEGIAVVLNELGRLEHSREKYDLTERYFREALNKFQQINHTNFIPAVLCNLGELAFNCEQIADARKYFNEGLSLAREIGQQSLVASALHGLARVHEAEGHPDLALPLAQEALAIFERLRHRDEAETRELVERLKKEVGER